MRATLLAMIVLGCGGVSDAELAKQICGPGTASVDAAAYHALTATSWYDTGACEAGGGLPPTCNRLRLDGNGSFLWTAVSDVVERMQSGAWNFRARDATSGVVCLGDGSVVDFVLRPGGELDWGPLGALSPEVPSPPGTERGLLPQVAVDPLFVQLTRHDWAKTNEMDLYREATSFALHSDGTFDAEFRGGACTESGTFSLIRERYTTGSRFRLSTHPDSGRCDPRNGGIPSFQLGDTPRFEDGVLSASGGTYRDASFTTDERYLRFSSYYQAGLTVAARWNGALHTGALTRWAMALHNDGTQPQTVASLRVDLTPATMTSDGYTIAGPAVTAADLAIGKLVAPGATLTLDEVAFIPAPAGSMIVRIVVESSDGRQSYHNQESYLVEL